MYYASMFRCWELIRILVMTNHPCLRVGRHRGIQRRGQKQATRIRCQQRQGAATWSPRRRRSRALSSKTAPTEEEDAKDVDPEPMTMATRSPKPRDHDDKGNGRRTYRDDGSNSGVVGSVVGARRWDGQGQRWEARTRR
jgi:hypothetical protein